MDLFSIQPLVMGLPAIDESLNGLLEYLRDNSPNTLGNLTGLAVQLGMTFAVCVGAYECWMMMLNRRVIDVMKLLRIIGLAMCITASGEICTHLYWPGKALESTTKGLAKSKNKEVAKREAQVAQLQEKYYQKVRALQDSIETAKRIQEIGEDASIFDKIEYSISNLGNTIDNFSKRAAIVTETKITEWANLIIRFIGESIFQIAYYALLVMQLVFMKLLRMFAPIMFALSILPPWNNAWSQWMSKYLSISLWGFVIYLCVYYADAILLYTLEKDMTAYTALIGRSNIGSWDSIGALGMQGIGSTCMYFVGMCIGAVLLKSVPEVCSWLIPGGVSSSTAGSTGSSMISTAVQTGATTSAIAGLAGGTVRGAGRSASSIAATVGAAHQAHNQGHSFIGSVAQGVVATNNIGKAFTAGSKAQQDFSSATSSK